MTEPDQPRTPLQQYLDKRNAEKPPPSAAEQEYKAEVIRHSELKTRRDILKLRERNILLVDEIEKLERRARQRGAVELKRLMPSEHVEPGS